jgi:predicted phage terminase large subunit-like protein
LTPDEVKRAKVLHVLLLQDYKYFIRYFFKLMYRQKWRQWEHLIQIADVMERVIKGELTRVIINVAPRMGKTDVAVKFFISHCLALNSASKFIHLSFSDTLALDNSEAARDIISNPEYQLLFPNVKIKKGSDSKHKWYTTDNGGVYATAAGGPVTGFGAGRLTDDESSEEDFSYLTAEIETLDQQSEANSWLGEKAKFQGAIIIDDPNKVDDSDSEVQRNRVNERYDSTISNRVNSRKTPIIILQQRTHENDLSGYLIKKQGKIEDGGVWHVLSLPSIKEDGTALCPDKYTIEELRAMEKHNEIVFFRQHLQDPKPRAGLLFPIQDLQFYDPVEMEAKLNDPDFCYVPCDPAGDGPDDFASAPFKLIGKKIYVTDMIYNTQGSDDNEIAMVEMIIKHKAKAAGVESTFGWVESSKRVKEKLLDLEWPGEYRNLTPKTNKHSRILNQSSFIRNNFVFRKDYDQLPQYSKFMRILTSYMKIQEAGMKNKHDDGPDLCCMAAQYYERNFPHLWEIKMK